MVIGDVETRRLRRAVLMDAICVFVCAIMFGLTIFGGLFGEAGFIFFVASGVLMVVFACDICRLIYRENLQKNG